jgi:xanthine/uracil permease
MVVFESEKTFQFTSGLIIGLPILLGTIIAFLPADIMNTFPIVLKPILGNGFVVGVATALILEHVIFRK